MNDTMLAYFFAERRDALLALIVGTIAVGASAWLVGTRHTFRGAALPLAIIALIEFGVGISYLSRNADLVPTLFDQLRTAPTEMARGELARMTTVLRNFRITVILEALVLVIGAACALTARRDFTFAMGLGLMVQCAPLLIADSLGTRRADLYMNALRNFLTG